MQNSGPNPANDYLVWRLVTSGDTFFEMIQYLGFWEMIVLTDAEKKYPALVNKLRSGRAIEILWKGYLQALQQMDSNVPLEPPKDVQDQNKGRWYVDTVMQAAFAIFHRQREELEDLKKHHPLHAQWNEIDALKVNKRNFNIDKLIARHQQLNAFNEALIKTKIDLRSDKLCISNLGITRIPATLFQDKDLAGYWCKLKLLECSFNHLKELPDAIDNLMALELLDCSRNKLARLCKSIGNLKALRVFICKFNKLQQLPDTIDSLMALRVLDCSENKLQQLPNVIGNLEALLELDCKNNQLEQLPDSIGNPRGLQKLYRLDCRNNKLRELPNDIGKLARLQWFYCVGNNFTKLPSSLLVIFGEQWCKWILSKQNILSDQPAILTQYAAANNTEAKQGATTEVTNKLEKFNLKPK